MTIEQILEIVEKYKLRMPPTAFYELKADIVNFEEPTAKNDLGVDCISRAEVLKLMKDNWHSHNGDWAMQESMDDIRALPSVTPQEPILDKLRAEIIELRSRQNVGVLECLDIIDKYKAESEKT